MKNTAMPNVLRSVKVCSVMYAVMSSLTLKLCFLFIFLGPCLVMYAIGIDCMLPHGLLIS